MIVLFDTLLEPGLLNREEREGGEGEGVKGEGVGEEGEKESQKVGEGGEENKDTDEDRGNEGKVRVWLLSEVIICGVCLPLARQW